MNNIQKSGIEPVLNKDNEPCWLTTKYVDKTVDLENTTLEQLAKDTEPIEKILEFELKPQGLWQCKKCGGIIQNIEGKPFFCTECKRDANFDIVTKKINTDLWKLPKWKDIPNDEIDMQGLYSDLLDLSKRCIIFVEEILYKIFVLWIISTWKTGVWNTVCFPTFLGLINSGKSKCLDFIRETGYRMLHCSGVTFPAMVRASHFYQAGILIDEVQNKLNPRDEKGREYIDFIKPSYRKGSKYTVADKEDQEQLISYNNFGFKAFAGEKGFDAGLMDRTILFEMEQDYPDITNFAEAQTDFNQIQTRLLNYRYKLNDPEPMKNGILRGRTKEIYECIISTGKNIGIKVDDVIKYAKGIEIEKQDDLIGTIEWEILESIKNKECNETLDDAPEEIRYNDILDSIGWENDRKHSQRLGYYVSKSLRLKTKRKNYGTVILLNDPKNNRKLKYLYRRFKV